jgi:hypothetical protein
MKAFFRTLIVAPVLILDIIVGPFGFILSTALGVLILNDPLEGGRIFVNVWVARWEVSERFVRTGK